MLAKRSYTEITDRCRLDADAPPHPSKRARLGPLRSASLNQVLLSRQSPGLAKRINPCQNREAEIGKASKSARVHEPSTAGYQVPPTVTPAEHGRALIEERPESPTPAAATAFILLSFQLQMQIPQGSFGTSPKAPRGIQPAPSRYRATRHSPRRAGLSCFASRRHCAIFPRSRRRSWCAGIRIHPD